VTTKLTAVTAAIPFAALLLAACVSECYNRAFQQLDLNTPINLPSIKEPARSDIPVNQPKIRSFSAS
jgi:hypothetical protein